MAGFKTSSWNTPHDHSTRPGDIRRTNHTAGKAPHNTEGAHFTADYIVDADDNVAFLEGRPPHHLGAHPCCFPMGETQGLALTPKNEILDTSP